MNYENIKMQIDSKKYKNLIKDIEKLRASEKALKNSERKYRRLVEAVEDEYVIYSHDLDGNFFYISPSIVEVLGYTQEEFMGHYTEYMTDNPVNKEAINITNKAYTGIKQRSYEAEYFHKNGKRVYLRTTEVPVYNEKGILLGIEGIVQDITQKKKLESNLVSALNELQDTNKELENKKTYIEDILNSMVDGLLVLDNDGNTKDANQSMIKMLGCKNFSELLNIHPLQITPDFYKTIFSKNKSTNITKEDIPQEVEISKRNGEKIPVSIIKSSLKNSNNEITGSLVIVRDLSELKKIEKMAYKDELTGLINRKPFIEILKRTLIESRTRSEQCALLCIDILSLRKINDSYGRNIGDKVLKIAAKKIFDLLNPTDFACRLGGDEFLICLRNIKSIKAPVKLAAKINKIPVGKILNNQNFNLNVNIGISIFPKDGEDTANLIRASEIAMYNSKKQNSSKNMYSIFNSEYKAKLEFNNALNAALKNNEFLLHYQPIVDDTGQCKFIEALLRWNSPKYGLVPPLKFISLLEESGMINQVGIWIVQEAARTIKKINSIKKLEDIGVTINVSIIQLARKDFVSKVKNVLTESEAKPRNINFEITETQNPYYNYSYIISVLKELKEMGTGILLDDFGSGFSSLENIIKFPIDIIKLDKFFLDAIKENNALLPILSGVFYTAKETNKKILAEGIETYFEFSKLKDKKCHYFQGYYFSKPVQNIVELLSKTKGNLMPGDSKKK